MWNLNLLLGTNTKKIIITENVIIDSLPGVLLYMEAMR